MKLIGIGNYLRGDDGIGPHIVEMLERSELFPDVEIISLQSDLYMLLNYLLENEPIIIVDAARMNLVPGELRVFRLHEMDLPEFHGKMNPHTTEIAQIYKISRELGSDTPCTVIGVEPENLKIGEELSENVINAIPRIISEITREAAIYAGKKDINYR